MATISAVKYGGYIETVKDTITGNGDTFVDGAVPAGQIWEVFITSYALVAGAEKSATISFGGIVIAQYARDEFGAATASFGPGEGGGSLTFSTAPSSSFVPQPKILLTGDEITTAQVSGSSATVTVIVVKYYA